MPWTENKPWLRLEEIKLLSVSTNITIETIAQINPAIATVVNFGVSGLHLSDTEKTEKPTADRIPNKRPKIEPLLVLPNAIIIIPIAAIIIAIQTLNEIFSF